MLDAPVSGGVVGAENATLAVMVGGDREAFDRYEPLLQAIGENIFHMGEVGSGVLVKLINNMVALTSQQIVHEAVVLAEASGLDPLRAHEVMSVSSAQRYVAGIPRLLERDFDDPPFSLALAEKDVRLALEVAADANVALPVGAAAHENLLRAKARGLGEKSLGATLLVYEEAARITL
jgi:3-hydroxyisobutyrate dehydrogenase-like beta-hydroxyacid dehydrogenase